MGSSACVCHDVDKPQKCHKKYATTKATKNYRPPTHTFIQAYCHWRQRFVLAIAWFSPHFPGFSLPGKDARSGRESCENL